MTVRTAGIAAVAVPGPSLIALGKRTGKQSTSAAILSTVRYTLAIAVAIQIEGPGSQRLLNRGPVMKPRTP